MQRPFAGTLFPGLHAEDPLVERDGAVNVGYAKNDVVEAGQLHSYSPGGGVRVARSCASALTFGYTACGQPIEELNYTSLQRILCANDLKTIALDQLLEHLGAVS